MPRQSGRGGGLGARNTGSHPLICTFIHSFVHATNVYSAPTKYQEGGYPYPCFAEGNPGFRTRKGFTPGHSANKQRAWI